MFSISQLIALDVAGFVGTRYITPMNSKTQPPMLPWRDQPHSISQTRPKSEHPAGNRTRDLSLTGGLL